MKHYKGKRGKPSRKIWEILRLQAKERDKDKCALCGNPEDLQIDHCFSASQAVRLRYDLRNLTTLCSICHTKKTYCIEGFEKRVDELVKEREGINVWKEMFLLSQKSGTWTLFELEQMLKELNGD